LAGEYGGIELANSGVFQNAIVHAIKSFVTLVEDSRLNSDPVVFCEERGVARYASKLDETTTPVFEVVEVSS